MAPRVAGLEKFPGGIGNRIEMPMSELTLNLTGMILNSLVAGMLFELTNNWGALYRSHLGDRHSGTLSTTSTLVDDADGLRYRKI